MKRYLVQFFILLSCASVAYSQGLNTSVKIHGEDLSCIEKSGRDVPVSFDEEAMQIGGGAYTSFDIDRGMSIIFSKTYVDSISKLGALFTFYHECAHATLPIGVGLMTEKQEINADCHAIAQMRKFGLLPTWKEFSDAMSILSQSPGDLQGHLPGPQRLATAARCAHVPAIYNTNAICRGIDRVFSAGPNRLKKFEDNGVFSGFYCESLDDNSRLLCRRDIDDKQTRISTSNKISAIVEGCLPSNFKKSISKSMPEFSIIFENEDSAQTVVIQSDYAGQVVLEVDTKSN